jgi:hypothetical protein
VITLALVLHAVSVCAAWQPEFDWVACGAITIGDEVSEASVAYQGGGPVKQLRLRYKDTLTTTVTARVLDGAEHFTVPVPVWRGQRVPVAIVLAKTLDSADPPVELTVNLGKRELGRWLTVPPSGPRQLYESYYAIPYSEWHPATRGTSHLAVTVITPEPLTSLGYRFYHTRDWDVLGEAYARDILARRDEAPEPIQHYLDGLQYEAQHDWRRAWRRYLKAARIGSTNLARLARTSARRSMLRLGRAAARIVPASDTADRHYRLGLMASALGCWPDAYGEFARSVALDPTNADAAWRMAEAGLYAGHSMAVCSAHFAAAAAAVRAPATSTQHILLAVCTNAAVHPGAPLGVAPGEVAAQWRTVADLVYAATRGALDLQADTVVRDDAAAWRRDRLGDIHPPPDLVPADSTYDFCICLAGLTQQWHVGVERGCAGTPYACVPLDAHPEELFAAWYGMLEDVCACNEDLPVFPLGAGGRLCGRHPSACPATAWCSILRRLVAPADLRRQQVNARLPATSTIAFWELGPESYLPDPPEVVDAVFEEWLTAEQYMVRTAIEQQRLEWKAQRARAALASATAELPNVPWQVFLRQAWFRSRAMDDLRADQEQAFINGDDMPAYAPRALTATGGYIDCTALMPAGPRKRSVCVRTYLHAVAPLEARLWLGYNARASVWLNGVPVHAAYRTGTSGQTNAYDAGLYAVNVVLQPGVNVLAAKVERAGGAWSFGVHLVDPDNRPVDGVTVTRTSRPRGAVPAGSPSTNAFYAWERVADDWYRALPCLHVRDLRRITGMPALSLDAGRVHLRLPNGTPIVPGSRYRAEPSPDDVTLDNSLNWDRECVAALRFSRNRRTRDLLLVRPEYLEEYTRLLKITGTAQLPAESLWGYLLIPSVTYGSTPDRGARAVLVLETELSSYPDDGRDLLSSVGAAAYIDARRAAAAMPATTPDE